MDRIKHFILPEHTNKLYSKEGASSLALTKNIAKKINEIVDALNKINSDDLLWKHEQEGRIEKGVLFMKDNLLNSLHDLLKLFKDSGEIESIVTESIIEGYNTLKLRTDGFVSVKEYGAAGDGVTDDTAAILEAITNNKYVYIPTGTYKVTDLTVGDCEIIGANDSSFDVYGTIMVSDTYNTKISNVTLNACGESRDYLMYIKKSYYGVFERLKFRNDNKAVNTAMIFDSKDYCYYHTVFSCVFSDYSIGVKTIENANAILIDKNEFYQCDIGVVIDACDGNRVTNNTFQTFYKSGVKLDRTENTGTPCNGNYISGNYFEADGKSIDTTYIGDIDCSNNVDVRGNFIIANQWTWLKTKSHVVNTYTGNYNHVLDHTYKDYNVPNTLAGFVAHEVMPETYKTYNSNEYHGVIAPFKAEDGTTHYCVFGRTESGNAWQRILTCGYTEDDTVTLPPITSKSIHQYYNQFIQLGYDYTGETDRAVTWETNHEMVKVFNPSTKAWEYLQKIVSGTTANRPTWKPRGYMYYDSTLGKPIWSTGSNTWVDATGASV